MKERLAHGNTKKKKKTLIVNAAVLYAESDKHMFDDHLSPPIHPDVYSAQD